MEQSRFLECLASHALFSGLDQAHLEFLVAQGGEQSFEQGQVVARQGEHAAFFYLILDGELAVEVPAITGPKLEVACLREGQVFGWSWLIEPYKWHFNARATRATRVLGFDGAAILKHCEEDVGFGYALFRRFSTLMGQRLEAAQRKMMDQWSPPGFA